jgi:tetratricopeptide (TPR) repeat protein
MRSIRRLIRASRVLPFASFFFLLLSSFFLPAAPAAGQVLVAGSRGTPESDLSPEQEQMLLGEYWTVAKKYKLDPAKAVAEMTAWTRDRIGKAQAIQFQPEQAGRAEYVKSKAEWSPESLRLAAMLHSDLGMQALLRNRNLAEFEFQTGIADGWFVLADNRQTAPGSIRARWNVTVARVLLVYGEVGAAERTLIRVGERIPNDPAILLTHGTVKETQAARMLAEVSSGRLDEPATSGKPRNAALDAAAGLFERALKVNPSLIEARLRLARLAILRRDDARADALLTEVLAAQLDPSMKYVALLLQGDVRQRQGQMDVAAKAYLDAIVTSPDGQSAYMALSQILLRSGQRADAATVLDRWYARKVADTTADPWWTYPLGFKLTMDAEFEEYRAQVRK